MNEQIKNANSISDEFLPPTFYMYIYLLSQQKLYNGKTSFKSKRILFHNLTVLVLLG